MSLHAYENYMAVLDEISADMNAMKTLQSGKGAIDFMNQVLDSNLNLAKEIGVLAQVFFSPTGEDRLDTSHPSLQQRKEMALEFEND
ncbi:MAG: hypothetical protein HY324_03405 [Chlamydiia bacterium]|nr:hypothetical protein [Chlamydiia bacterium]